MRRSEAFDRFSRPSAELDAAQFALAHVISVWGSDALLACKAQLADVSMTELSRASATLELTFTLRLFAEYEAVLRDYWAVGLGRPSRPDMRVLMDSVGRRRRIAAADLQAAHVVPDYRNAITHVGPPATLIQLADCQRGLGRYLRWLPQQW
jgi:hypothetical protein